ncbi:MAG: DUF998 domain-containing protein [Candidatus Diapherotrites archaeon]|nr:DUF998 domain-containing protein [Candidatus Diapherotrites archaeon]
MKKYFGLLGVFFFLVFTAIAILNYVNYNFTGQYLSELGIGSTSAFWFNTGLILAGFSFAAYFFLNFDSIQKITGIFAGLSLSGVGIFPMNIAFEHFVTAAGFFILAGITALLYSLEKLKIDKKLSLIGFGFVLIDLVFLIFRESPILQKIAVACFGVWVILVSLQKVWFQK